MATVCLALAIANRATPARAWQVVSTLKDPTDVRVFGVPEVSRSPQSSSTWQVDFYRCPLTDESGQVLWALVACSSDGTFEKVALCPQHQADSKWIGDRLQQWFRESSIPASVQVFRPQSLAMITQACERLSVAVNPTRRTSILKQRLQVQAQLYPRLEGYTQEAYDPITIESAPPEAIPEEFQGDRWQFAALSRSDLLALTERVIPVKDCALLANLLSIAPDASVPGVIVYGDRRSLALAQWLQATKPVSLGFVSGDPHGIILEAGLSDRWVMATFTDTTVLEAASKFEHRKTAANGTHFLLVMPDDSGTTTTGLWILADE
ncbi:MAG: Tab2/Atab2 family RNA-binding protein [Cyanobacteria bacterium P01_A01_bin.3]